MLEMGKCCNSLVLWIKASLCLVLLDRDVTINWFYTDCKSRQVNSTVTGTARSNCIQRYIHHIHKFSDMLNVNINKVSEVEMKESFCKGRVSKEPCARFCFVMVKMKLGLFVWVLFCNYSESIRELIRDNLETN